MENMLKEISKLCHLPVLPYGSDIARIIITGEPEGRVTRVCAIPSQFHGKNW
jgi:hypothetical protein